MITTTLSYCTTKQYYSIYNIAIRVFHSLWKCISAFLLHTLYNRIQCILYHWGCSNFTRRYYRNHSYFIFLLLMICLSPEGYHRLLSIIRTQDTCCHAIPFTHTATFFFVTKTNRSIEFFLMLAKLMPCILEISIRSGFPLAQNKKVECCLPWMW